MSQKRILQMGLMTVLTVCLACQPAMELSQSSPEPGSNQTPAQQQIELTPTQQLMEPTPTTFVQDDLSIRLARRYNLSEGYLAEPIYTPELPFLFDVALSETGIIYLSQWADFASLSTYDPVTGEITPVLEFPSNASVGWMTGGPGDQVFVGVDSDVWLVNPDGRVEVWGPRNESWPVWYTSDGRLLGVFNNTSLVEMKPDGSRIMIADNFEAIFDVTADSQGVIFVTDFNRGDLTRIDTDGTQIVLDQGFIYHDYSVIYIDKQDQLYFFCPGKGLRIYDKVTGEFLYVRYGWPSCNLVGSQFIITDDNMAYFVNTQAQLIQIDLEGQKSQAAVKNNGVWSWAMTTGPDDLVYLGAYECQQLEAQVVRIQPDGSSELFVDGFLGRVKDLTFTSDGGLYMISEDADYHLYYVEPGASTVTEIPDVPDGVSSVVVHPVSGNPLVAVWGGELKEYVDGSGWVKRNMSFPKELEEFIIDSSPDGTIYAYASEKERQWTGPVVERWILRLDLVNGRSEIVAQYDRDGCCTMGNLSVDSNGDIWWILNPENLLYKVTPEGQMTLFAEYLPQDSAKVVSDGKGNVYISSIIGVIRIYKPE